MAVSEATNLVTTGCEGLTAPDRDKQLKGFHLALQVARFSLVLDFIGDPHSFKLKHGKINNNNNDNKIRNARADIDSSNQNGERRTAAPAQRSGSKICLSRARLGLRSSLLMRIILSLEVFL